VTDFTDPKATLLSYLQSGRDALLWKLDGLSDYDARRPLTRTGTNVLGVIKHVASVLRSSVTGEAALVRPRCRTQRRHVGHR